LRWRSSGEHSNLELAVEVRRGAEEGGRKEEGGRRKEEAGRLTKSNNPYLTGGEKIE